MRYQPLHHARKLPASESSSGLSFKMKPARCVIRNISLLFLPNKYSTRARYIWIIIANEARIYHLIQRTPAEHRNELRSADSAMRNWHMGSTNKGNIFAKEVGSFFLRYYRKLGE